MEKDFMGLSLKESLAMVKDEILHDGAHNSGVQWSFSGKVQTVPHLIPSIVAHDHDKAKKISSDAPMVVLDDLFHRNNLKSSASPQLTIFYAGSVNVYNDISPEKVQTIMFMAADGVSHPKSQGQGVGTKIVAKDIVSPMNQSLYSPPHCSGLSSPLSFSSHTGAQSGSGSTSTDELSLAKSSAIPTTPGSKAEPPRVMKTNGSVLASTMLSSAVPQARKASLARFLEKRKERAMNAAPYNLLKKSEDCVVGK